MIASMLLKILLLLLVNSSFSSGVSIKSGSVTGNNDEAATLDVTTTSEGVLDFIDEQHLNDVELDDHLDDVLNDTAPQHTQCDEETKRDYPPPSQQEGVGLSHDEPAGRAKRGMQTNVTLKWTVGTPIPYFFDSSSLAPSTIALIRQGLQFWQNNTCLSFEENQQGASALRFFKGSGCYSSVGKQNTASQDVSIGTGCENFGTVTHEIGHALGLYHTQSRPDRDSYVIINFKNIEPAMQYNFVKNAPNTDDSFGVPFDYGSVMMYNQYAFALNLSTPSVTAVNKYYQLTMGQRAGPAWSDVKIVDKAYQCDSECASTACQNGGLPHPRDCTRCLCPRSFGGNDCSAVPTQTAPICQGTTLQASSTTQSLVASVGTNDYVAYPTASECFWLITAPVGKKITLRLTSSPSSCVDTCTWQGLELNLGSFETYGITMCCPSMVGVNFTTTANMASIRGYSRSHLSNFTIEYTIAG